MVLSRGSLLLLILLASTSALVGQKPKALSPFPPDGFQFTGSWDCEGSFGNGKLHKAAFTAAVILNGTWLELTEQDVAPATGYVARYLIGDDSENGRLVEFDANNFGAAVYSSNEGWKNGVLTMTSPVTQESGSGYLANRFLYSIIDQNTFTVDWQISRTAALEWRPSDHLACKRK